MLKNDGVLVFQENIDYSGHFRSLEIFVKEAKDSTSRQIFG